MCKGILCNIQPKQKTGAEIKRSKFHLKIPKLSEDKAKPWEEELTKKIYAVL